MSPTLPTLLPADQWLGTPVDAKGCFHNHEFPFQQSFGAVWRWQTRRNPQRTQKRADPFRLPVVQTDRFLTGTDDVVVWLGHASFFVRLNGVRLLIDPVFAGVPFTKRLSALPLDPARFTVLDYVLVSHAHYDHCDKSALRQLYHQNPEVQVLTGLGMPALLGKWLPGAAIQGSGWYQRYRTDPRLRVSFVTARHWSNRGLGDVNETLWGGFVLQGGGRQVYFSGDSGYGSHYRQIGQLFPGLDVALLGAGAYAPRWFMGPNHQDPAQAVQAFRDVQARQLVPMHYDTFDLSDEPVGEALVLLRQLEAAGRLQPPELRLLAVGESLGLSYKFRSQCCPAGLGGVARPRSGRRDGQFIRPSSRRPESARESLLISHSMTKHFLGGFLLFLGLSVGPAAGQVPDSIAPTRWYSSRAGGVGLPLGAFKRMSDVGFSSAATVYYHLGEPAGRWWVGAWASLVTTALRPPLCKRALSFSWRANGVCWEALAWWVARCHWVSVGFCTCTREWAEPRLALQRLR